MSKNFNLDQQLSERLAIALSAQSDVYHNLFNEIALLKKEINQIKDRQAYIEYDLHAENQLLKDQLSEKQCQPNYSSEDYCSNADFNEREYSAERLGSI
ncbi:hypothetical protein [Floridanema evergladense]|uniref:Uncharacterized protein n=1 Tax=Floridaenema evergladense BLCC-F167 TaxID=3153639 RepID=A0ABV4WGT5_9CYAN